jgi:hypothetical protein
MRKKTMVSERDRETARTQHCEEESHLKAINPKKPEVQWDCRDRQEQGSNQK